MEIISETNSLSDESLQMKYNELKQEISRKREMRRQEMSQDAINVSRLKHQNNKKNLKSDVKKTSAFVNKLRSMNSEALLQSIRDVDTLNLTLYISEIVNAILEVSFKPADVPLIVKLCVSLHQRYEDFTEPLLSQIKDTLVTNYGVTSANEDKETATKKRRIQIRLLLELYEAGVLFEDGGLFLSIMKNLTGKQQQKKGPSVPSKRPIDLMGISTFVKYGSESLLGFPSKTAKSILRSVSLDQVENYPAVSLQLCSNEVSKELKDMVMEVWTNLNHELEKAFKDLKKKEKKADNDKLVHGTLSDQKTIELETARKLFERLFTMASTLSESLYENLSVLEEEPTEEELAEATSISKGISVFRDGGIGNADYSGPFGDTESRSFYEDLPDLLNMVPLNILGLNSEQAAVLREQWKIAKETKYAGPTSSTALSTDEKDIADPATVNDGNESLESETTDVTSNSNTSDETPQARVLILIENKLPECTTRAKCDEFCVNFCFLNSKSSRKKLAEALSKIPYGRGELVSTYARFDRILMFKYIS